MNASTPPPVPWWERVAAGGLAAIWVIFYYERQIPPRAWWNMIREGLAHLHKGWLDFVAGNAGVAEMPFLGAAFGGLLLSLEAAVPVLVAGGVAIGSGFVRGQRRSWLWWLTLCHGPLLWLSLSVQGRLFFLARAESDFEPRWYEGWLFYFEGGLVRRFLPGCWPHLTEILLAALVLWFSRKQRAKPNAAEDTPAP